MRFKPYYILIFLVCNCHLTIGQEMQIDTVSKAKAKAPPYETNSFFIAGGSTNGAVFYKGQPTFGLGYERTRNRFTASAFMNYCESSIYRTEFYYSMPDFNYLDKETNLYIDLMLHYNFFRTTSKSNLTLGSGISSAFIKLQYHPLIIMDYSRFLSFYEETSHNTIFMIPIGLGYSYKISQRLDLGVKFLVRFAPVAKVIYSERRERRLINSFSFSESYYTFSENSSALAVLKYYF